jgi:hypothetical protein
MASLVQQKIEVPRAWDACPVCCDPGQLDTDWYLHLPEPDIMQVAGRPLRTGPLTRSNDLLKTGCLDEAVWVLFTCWTELNAHCSD